MRPTGCSTESDCTWRAWRGPGCRSGQAAGSTCRRVQAPGPGVGRDEAREKQGSGSDRLADADLGGRGLGGNARAAGREARPGLGPAVAVPVAVHVNAAAGQAGQDAAAAPRGRRGERPGGTRTRLAVIAGAGRLAVAAPVRVVVMIARRAAVNDIWRGWTGWPARLPLPAGTATAAGARATGRARPVAVTQAACSWAIRAGDWDRSIAPVGGPAPLIADL